MRIAVVEDEADYRNEIVCFLKRYGSEHEGICLEIDEFSDGAELLIDYKPIYDIVLLDIEMPHSNGIDVAKKIREADQSCVIMFITNMVQFAVQGYEVEALDFIVKPVRYFQFAFKLDRALAAASRRMGQAIAFSSDRQQHRVFTGNIYYLESVKHCVTVHAVDRNFEIWHKTLNELEKQLSQYGFARCNVSFLVNLRYVRTVNGNEVRVGPETITLSRGKKKEFLSALSDYMG